MRPNPFCQEHAVFEQKQDVSNDDVNYYIGKCQMSILGLKGRSELLTSVYLYTLAMFVCIIHTGIMCTEYIYM